MGILKVTDVKERERRFRTNKLSAIAVSQDQTPQSVGKGRVIFESKPAAKTYAIKSANLPDSASDTIEKALEGLTHEENGRTIQSCINELGVSQFGPPISFGPWQTRFDKVQSKLFR
ncbi:hypothetical protein ACFLRA_01040 [Bdellovibrionota bacterium]